VGDRPGKRHPLVVARHAPGQDKPGIRPKRFLVELARTLYLILDAKTGAIVGGPFPDRAGPRRQPTGWNAHSEVVPGERSGNPKGTDVPHLIETLAAGVRVFDSLDYLSA